MEYPLQRNVRTEGWKVTDSTPPSTGRAAIARTIGARANPFVPLHAPALIANMAVGHAIARFAFQRIRSIAAATATSQGTSGRHASHARQQDDIS